MTDTKDRMLPGEHSHSDRPNWQPEDEFNEYWNKVRDGKEKFSNKRYAEEVLGMSRAAWWRCRLMADLPEGLIQYICQKVTDGKIKKVPGARTMARLALALRRGENLKPEIERCPHCGEVLRERRVVNDNLRDIVVQWAEEEKARTTTPAASQRTTPEESRLPERLKSPGSVKPMS